MGFLKKALKGWSPSNFFSGKNEGFENMIGGSFNNLLGTSDAAAQSYRYSQLGADADMQRSLYLWNLQNEYNSPKAQIARMAEAGIDVNPMTYAVGNGSMSTTASNISAPSTGGASMASSGVNPITALFGVLQGIQSYKASVAEIDKIISETSNAKKLAVAQVDKMKAETDRIKLENKYNKDTGSAPNEPGSIRTVRSAWNFITKPFGGFNKDVEVYDPTLPKFGSNVRRRK